MCGRDAACLNFSIKICRVTVPVARLELGILKGSNRQCSELRRVVFHRARKVMLHVKTATSDLLKQYPLELFWANKIIYHHPMLWSFFSAYNRLHEFVCSVYVIVVFSLCGFLIEVV
jgi:hypothetical protein